MKKRILALVLALALCMGLVPAAYAADLQPFNSINRNAQNYAANSLPIKSYLYQNPSGGLTRVEHTGGGTIHYSENGQMKSFEQKQEIVIENYSSSFQLQSSTKIPMELDLWGGFYAGRDYNFVVVGQENPGMSSGVEVIRVIKYDKNWNRLGAASLKGANTTVPFDASNVRCAEYNGYLFIHTCHEMYNGHQSNLTFAVKQSDMSITDSFYEVDNNSSGYVSHSFNQFILVDQDGKVVTVNHGDGFPRGVAFTKYKADAGAGRFTGGEGGQGAWCSYACLAQFAGSTGYNSTGGSVGGLEETSTGYVVAYNYDGGHSSNSDPRHVYLAYVSKDGQTSAPKQLTTTIGNTTPVLASTGLSGGYIMWNGEDKTTLNGGSVYYDPNDTLYYAAYDAGGNVGQIKTAKAMLSDCDPILYNGKLVWYTDFNTVLTFYTLDASGVSAASMASPFVAPAIPGKNTSTTTTNPTEPTNPAEPTEPTNSAEPTNPATAGTPVKPAAVPLLNDANVTYGSEAFVSADGAATIGGVKMPGGPYKAVDGIITQYGSSYYLLKEDGTVWKVEGDTVAGCAKAVPVKLEEENVEQIRPGVTLKKDGTLWTSYTLDGKPAAGGSGQFMDNVKQFYTVKDNSWNGMAVKKDGSLWTWGFDVGGYGGHGDPWLGQDVGRSDPWWEPRKVMDNVAYATATMAIKTDGTLWSWGTNTYCSVGNGSTQAQPTPVKVLDDVVGAWCSYYEGGGMIQKYALTKDGTLYSWGDNRDGWLGYEGGDHTYTIKATGKTCHCQSTPKATGITDVARVLDGGMLQKTDGSVWTITQNGLGRQVAGGVMLTQVPILEEAPAYTVTASAGAGGTVSVSPQKAKKGELITVTVTPGAGYEPDGMPTIKDARGGSFALASQGGGRYTFVMGEADATVSAKFKPISNSMESKENPFRDVPAGEYFYDPVQWAVEKGVTTGTSSTAFSPYETCTRAQTVTFLWRAAGSPSPSSTRNPFTDVKSGDYFYNAVLWAVENGITNGTSATRFSPNDTVTRGQTVTFMFRNAKSPSVSGSNPFTDVRTGEYYADAVRWAVSKSITNGTSATTFGPNEGCTRGQIVTFLHRAVG